MEAISGSSDSRRCSRGHGPDFVLWWSFQAVLIIKGTTSGTPAAPKASYSLSFIGCFLIIHRRSLQLCIAGFSFAFR